MHRQPLASPLPTLGFTMNFNTAKYACCFPSRVLGEGRSQGWKIISNLSLAAAVLRRGRGQEPGWDVASPRSSSCTETSLPHQPIITFFLDQFLRIIPPGAVVSGRVCLYVPRAESLEQLRQSPGGRRGGKGKAEPAGGSLDAVKENKTKIPKKEEKKKPTTTLNMF